MKFFACFLKQYGWRYFGIAFTAFALVGCAAKRTHYDVPVVPLPDQFKKTPAAVDSESILAAPATLAPTANTVVDNKPKTEKRLVKTTVAMPSDAFFEFDRDQLTPEAMEALNAVIETLRQTWYSGNIHLTGHTCDIGSDQYNQNLSERRALSIKKYLVDVGMVPPGTIIAEGRGENNPRYPNTKELRYKNRRVDLEFVTITENLEDVVLPSEKEPSGAAKQAITAKIDWEREYIDSEPAWLTRTQPSATPQMQPVTANGSPATSASASSSSPEVPAIPLESALDEWWRLLGSRELDALVDRALANNQDLRIAVYRVAQAEARSGQASADKAPVITVPVEVSNEAPYYGVGTVAPGSKASSKRTYKASIRGDWRADVWGELQANYESADFKLWGATFQRDDVQRTLIANVASTYVEYLSLNDRLRVARETELVLSGMVESSGQRMLAGDATIIDLEQMRTAVYAVRATIPVMELQREQALNNLAWLVGTVPGTLTLSDGGINSLTYPAVLPGVPSTLLLRRPDVRAIEAQLLVNDANVDVARTRVLPAFDLTAQVGYGSLHFSQWFQPQSLFWNAIANLSVTVFDSGKLSKEVDYARAVHEELVESYVRVIYGAVRDTENALMGVRMMGKRLQAQQKSVNAAKRAWDYSTESYSAGAIDHLVLLDTQRTYHSKLDELHQVAMNRYQSLVQLFSALGGGVRQGKTIPGKGLRPVQPIDVGSVQAAAPQVFSLDGVDFANSQQEGNEALWLAELPAVRESASVAATLRDLRELFPKLMVDRTLLPRQMGRVASADQEQAAWYRLFVAKFTDSGAAEAFCAELRSKYMRCRVVSSRSKAYLEGAVAPAKAIPATTQLPVAGPVVAPVQAAAIVAGEAELPQAGRISISPQLQPAAQPLSAPDKTAAGTSSTVEPASELVAAAQDSLEPKTDVEISPAPPEAGEGTINHGYAVQLGTFDNPAKAAQDVASWQAKGYSTYVYKTDGSHGRIWYTVRLGNFSQRASAATMAEAICKKEKIKAIPVPIILDRDNKPNMAGTKTLHASGGGG